MVKECLASLHESHCLNNSGSMNGSSLTVKDRPCKSVQHIPSEQTGTLRCRICFDSTDLRELTTPCYCTGTIGLMHRGCLEKWLNASKTNACEICNYEFKVEYAYPSFPEWLKHGGEGEYRARRRHLWTDCVCFVIMIPLMILCAWLTAASARSEGSPIRFSWQSISLGSLFAVLFVVFVIWIVFSIRYHYQSWLQWRHDNQNITLIEFASQINPVSEPVRTGYSPLVPSSAASNTSSLRSPVRSAPFCDVPDPTKTQVSSFSTANKCPSVHSLNMHQQSSLFILGGSSCETLSYPVTVHQDRTHINSIEGSAVEKPSFPLSMRNNKGTQQASDNLQSISKSTYSVCAPTDGDHGSQRIFHH